MTSARSVIALFLAAALAAPVRAQTESPPPRPPSELLSDAPLTVDQTIEMEKEQFREITVRGLQNFLVVDPTIVRVNQFQGANNILVYALSLGNTYVHVWTDEGRKTFQIRVVPTLAKVSPRSQRRAERFQIRHELATDSLYTRYRESDTRVNAQRHEYTLGMAGPTAFGSNTTNLLVSSRDGVNDISYMRTHFRNAVGDFQLGDVTAVQSDVTMPIFSFQGAQWKSPVDRKVTVDLLGGFTDRRAWGSKAIGLSDEQENSFVGYRAGIRPVKQLQLFTLGTRAFSDELPERQSNNGLGGRWQSGRWTLRSEGATSHSGAGAFMGDTVYARRHGYLELGTRDVNADYVTVNGNSWRRGERGHTQHLNLHDLGVLTFLDVRRDQFRTRYLPSNTRPFSLNTEWRGQMKLERQGLALSQDVLLQDYPGISGPHDSNTYLTKLANEEGRFAPNVTFRRSYEKFFENPTQDYSEYGRGLGFAFRQAPLVYSAATIESVSAKRSSTGERRDFINYYTEMRLQSRLGMQQFLHSLRFEYDDVTTRFSEKVRTFIAQVRTDYAAATDMNLYILGQFQNRSSTLSPSHSFELRTGLVLQHDTGIFRSRARRADGVVFKDLNGDGYRQRDEPGVPGLRLFVNDKISAVTDQEGRFRFKPQRGDLTVRLDTQNLPVSTRLSSSNPQTFTDFGDGKDISLSFGIAYKGEVTGSIFIDSNENEQIDPSDRPLSRVVVMLNKRESRLTDANGQFVFSGIAPGRYEIDLDVLTLPPDMVASRPTRQAFELPEGERKEFTFLVHPARLLGGVVFWDKNGNGQMDAGEPPVPGILVKTPVSRMASDKDGRFYLNHFKSGSVTLDVDRASLGDRWQLGGAYPKTYAVPAERPFIRRDENIPLKRLK